MHDAAEHGCLVHPYAAALSVDHTEPVADEISDAVAFADHTPIVRSTERAVRHVGVGAGGGDATLPVIRPRRHLGGAFDRARSREH